MPARQRAVVAMIDGLDPAYVTDETMPVFGRLAAEGTSRVVQAVMPTVTNVNNAGISCAAWPAEHGITGNYFYDRASGEQGYMHLLLKAAILVHAIWSRAASWHRLTAVSGPVRRPGSG